MAWANPAATEAAGGLDVAAGEDATAVWADRVKDNLTELGGTTGRRLALRREWLQAADIASAATTDLSTVEGNAVTVTGTTTITAFGTVNAGAVMVLKFAAALTVTHNATSLILLGGVNHVTVAGDVMVFVSEGSGNWREISRSSNTRPLITVTEAAPATPAASTIYKDGIPNAWCRMNISGGTPAIADDLNIASLTDNGVGDIQFNFATNMANATYAAVATCFEGYARIINYATTSVRVTFFTDAGAALDTATASVIVIGGQ